MRFTTAVVLAASAALAAAQSSGCAAQNIVDACLGTTTPQMNACGANDWGCLCNQSINVLTCYNNCPGDPKKVGVQQQSDSYCNAAKAYPSSSSSRPAATGSSTAAPASTASPTLPAGVTPSTSSSTPVSTASNINGSGANGGSSAVGVNVVGLIGALAFAMI